MKNAVHIIQSVFGLILIVLITTPKAFGVVPPPDGCYPNFNTAEGCNALNLLTTGAATTGVGWYSLFSVAGASFNTGVGAGTLVLNNADSNTAVGTAALLLNTTGSENTAVGTTALVNNSEGNYNDAVGGFALNNNVAGLSNNAFGDRALFSNVVGSNNTAVGDLALQNSIGDYNTALGARAGRDPDILSNNIYIGDAGSAGDTNVIAIGGIAASAIPYEACYIGGIYGTEVNQLNDAMPVYIDSDGHLGTVVPSANGKPAAPRARRGNAGQHQAMLNRKVEKLQATTAQQQKQIAEQERQIAALKSGLEKVSAKIELNRPEPQLVRNKSY